MSAIRRFVACFILSLIPAVPVLMPAAGLAQDFEYYTPKILTEPDAPFLPDFSYAGYQWGEEPIPFHAPTVNVADFGAVPDDGEDDTEAILAAVEAAHDQEGLAVVRFPPGRFILQEILLIERGNFVLQGSGSGGDGTIIDLPRPLWDMDFSRLRDHYHWIDTWLKNDRQASGSPFAFQGGIIWTHLGERGLGERVAAVRSGKRAGHELIVDATKPLEVGGVYRLLRMQSEPGSLIEHVIDVDMEVGSWTEKAPIFEYVTVTAIDGNKVTVKEPLFHDVRPGWNAVLEESSWLEHIGIEGLRFECGRTEYRGHHTERGYNPIGLANVRNGWVRDVSIDNADSGILTRRSYLVTFEDITVTNEMDCHYGVQIGVSQRCLARNISADMLGIHVLSVNTYGHGIVYTDCVVRRGRLDQHVGLNWQSLFDDIVVRDTEHGWGVFGHGGNAGTQFPLHAAFNTFWNLRLIYDMETVHDIPMALHGSVIPGAAVRLVCFRANVPLRIHYYNVDPYIEGTNKVIADEYASLYKWQLANRLGADHPEVTRVNSEIDLEISTNTLDVTPHVSIPMRSWFYSRSYHAKELVYPGGNHASLRWSIVPINAEAMSHTDAFTLPAGPNAPHPGETYIARAGEGKVLTDWLAPIEFPGPGDYEVTLVYTGAEGPGAELRSKPRVFRVRR